MNRRYVNFGIPESDLRRIDAYVKRNGYRTRAEAVRTIVMRAIAEDALKRNSQ